MAKKQTVKTLRIKQVRRESVYTVRTKKYTQSPGLSKNW